MVSGDAASEGASPRGRAGSRPARRAEEGIVLRRTRSQRIWGASARAACALPVLLAVPFVDAALRWFLAGFALVSALVVAALDLAARRDVTVEIGANGLHADHVLVPWWSVDEVVERSFVGSRSLRVRSFGSVVTDLPVPRTGPLVRNPDFAAEVALIDRAWKAYRDDHPDQQPGGAATADREAGGRGAGDPKGAPPRS